VLAIFAIIITLGGMKVIGYTDVIQVFFLILGGLATTYLALDLVATHFGSSGVLRGFTLLTEHADSHFQMIFEKDNENYLDLPGLTVLVGGMWIVNLNYWGCNQYITQRALGADLPTARKGLLFASFLKLLMPIIVVLPGIAAYVLYKEGYGDFKTDMIQGGEVSPDTAYPVLLNLLPSGLKGLSFAALTAAVVASLAGKANSIATIFTLDIYNKVIDKNAHEDKQVIVGRYTVVAAMLIAIVISPMLGIDKKGGFQFIQEYTGFFSPGIFAMFILGFFWKKTTSNAALFATIGGFILSVGFKFLPFVMDLSFLNSSGFSVPVVQKDGATLYEIPFLDRMGFVFIICMLVMFVISIYETRRGVVTKGLEIEKEMFYTSKGFAVGSLILLGLIAALYTVYW
jgi:solute:Na+ symporter, SSS family